MTRAFRLCKTKYSETAFTGEGSKSSGGRWNSPGIPMVYTSSSLSLATLEILVHLEDPEVLARLFCWIEVRIPDEEIRTLAPEDLPADWLEDHTFSRCRHVSDHWAASLSSPVLAVPSAVTEGELNFLINPLHPNLKSLEFFPPRHFKPDPRLS